MSGKKFTFKTAAAPKAVPKREKSTFKAFEKPEVGKIKADSISEESIIELLIHQDVSVWVPILLVAKDNERLKDQKDNLYSLDFVNYANKFFAGGTYSMELQDLPIIALCKAISRITSNIVYSNDNGRAYFAFDGLGELEGCNWVVKAPGKNLNVVPINSEQAVDAQIFCASVTIDSISKSVEIDGVFQNVSIPTFKKKNCPDKDRIPLSIKQIFKCLLKGVNWDDYSADDVKEAPWLWDYVYEAVHKIKLPATGIPLELAFFGFVKQTYDYTPMPLKLSDVIYTNYPRINKDILSQLNQHSFVVGGKPVQPGHFFNIGLNIVENKVLGGFVPEKYCRYNTNSNVTWERTGCFVESTLLNTKVTGPRDIKHFTGMWYDPAPVNAAHLAAASGLIVPYDKKGNGLARVEEWIEAAGVKLKDINLWATYGPQPLLWVEKSKSAKGYSHIAASVLWKCMPTMNLYNFACSLNRNSVLANCAGDSSLYEAESKPFLENAVPLEPLAMLRFEGRPVTVVVEDREKTVPDFSFVTFGIEFLPGRHLSKEKTKDVAEDALEDFDLYKDFADSMARDNPEDYADFARYPHAKRRKAAPESEHPPSESSGMSF